MDISNQFANTYSALVTLEVLRSKGKLDQAKEGRMKSNLDQLSTLIVDNPLLEVANYSDEYVSLLDEDDEERLSASIKVHKVLRREVRRKRVADGEDTYKAGILREHLPSDHFTSPTFESLLDVVDEYASDLAARELGMIEPYFDHLVTSLHREGDAVEAVKVLKETQVNLLEAEEDDICFAVGAVIEGLECLKE